VTLLMCVSMAARYLATVSSRALSTSLHHVCDLDGNEASENSLKASPYRDAH
jgi:hypothetical protein